MDLAVLTVELASLPLESGGVRVGTEGKGSDDEAPSVVLGLLESGEESSLGSLGFICVFNRSGGDIVVDDGQVGGLVAEAEGIGDVVHTSGKAIGVDVLVRVGDTAVGVVVLCLAVLTLEYP